MGTTANTAAMGAPVPMEIIVEAINVKTTKPLPVIPSWVLNQTKPLPMLPTVSNLVNNPIKMKVKINLELPNCVNPLMMTFQYLAFSFTKKKSAKRPITEATAKPFIEYTWKKIANPALMMM